MRTVPLWLTMRYFQNLHQYPEYDTECTFGKFAGNTNLGGVAEHHKWQRFNAVEP